MNYISPTRVSIYDFLYEDTQPITVLLADIAQLSWLQARIAINHSLQAIVSALLSYQVKHGGDAILKRLFNHSGVKTLRQYNSMNFVTMDSAIYHRQSVTDSLFPTSRSISYAAEHIASLIDAEASQVHRLLTTLCVICLRELAILADYAHLDATDVNNWLQLQAKFLSAARFNPEFIACDTPQIDTRHEQQQPYSSTASLVVQPPIFDSYWFQLTKYTPPPAVSSVHSDDGVPHYAKVIGRSVANSGQSLHDDLLAFATMPAVSLPNQRWLLQLAKISDIYLNRRRLKIASEPKNPPSRPLVNLSLFDSTDSSTNTPSTSTLPAPGTVPLWRNPVILILILVIGVLSGLALLKYQSQQAQQTLQSTLAKQPAKVIQH